MRLRYSVIATALAAFALFLAVGWLLLPGVLLAAWGCPRPPRHRGGDGGPVRGYLIADRTDTPSRGALPARRVSRV
jgi:hypothetical protein